MFYFSPFTVRDSRLIFKAPTPEDPYGNGFDCLPKDNGDYNADPSVPTRLASEGFERYVELAGVSRSDAVQLLREAADRKEVTYQTQPRTNEHYIEVAQTVVLHHLRDLARIRKCDLQNVITELGSQVTVA